MRPAPWKWWVAIFPASAMRLCFMCTTAEQGSNSNSDRRESPSTMTATRMLEPFSSTFRSAPGCRSNQPRLTWQPQPAVDLPKRICLFLWNWSILQVPKNTNHPPTEPGRINILEIRIFSDFSATKNGTFVKDRLQPGLYTASYSKRRPFVVKFYRLSYRRYIVWIRMIYP